MAPPQACYRLPTGQATVVLVASRVYYKRAGRRFIPLAQARGLRAATPISHTHSPRMRERTYLRSLVEQQSLQRGEDTKHEGKCAGHGQEIRNEEYEGNPGLHPRKALLPRPPRERG